MLRPHWFILLAALCLQACISIPPFGPSNDRGRLHLEVVEPAKEWFARDQVLLLPLAGLVTMGDQSTGFKGPGMLVALKDRLREAKKNKNIRAVVLRIDSPGGTVTAADLIYRELVQFKEQTRLPMIALLNGTAASGGLYIAMAADEIYALPTTITGSIGVIAMYPDLSELSRKIGFSMNVIKSGAMKDAGSPWRTLSEAEHEVFQQLVEDFHERFREVILKARTDKGMTPEGLSAVADGRILRSEQAVEAKLIDGILYHDEVIEKAKERAGLRAATVVSYEYPYHYRGHVYARGWDPAPLAAGAAPRGDVNLFSLNLEGLRRELVGARFLYLWMP